MLNLACISMILMYAPACDTPTGVPTPVPFRITVVDNAHGWPVPLVELRTTGGLRFITDNAGVVAVDAPELMNRETWFTVVADGYAAAADGFGFRGVRLTPVEGGNAIIDVTCTTIARRLGRLTGAGQFAESRKLGDSIDRPTSPIVGCDSVQNAVHNGQLFWVWGDTSSYRYPLGIFHASAATTSVRPIERFEPPVAVQFDYVVDDAGAPRGVAPMPGDGPTWLNCMISLPDAGGAARLVACYAKIRKPMNVYEWGLCTWNDDLRRFEQTRAVWREETIDGKPASGDAQAPMTPRIPEGHATVWTDIDGEEWVLFGNPFPTARCRATYEAFIDVDSWERLEPPQQLAVAARGEMDDAQQTVTPHSGSIAWHPWRKKWVTIFLEAWGSPSAFGEVWYAESESPFGPWSPAIKVLSHANYTFYNPRIHAEWFDAESPVLTFEGTYSQMFADRPLPTPRYDYNQILYRIDLDSPQLQSGLD